MKCRDCKNISFGFERQEPGERVNLFFGWCRKINDSPDLYRERECKYFVHFIKRVEAADKMENRPPERGVGGHMMDIEKLIYAVKLCGRTPKVDQCKQCAYWSGGDMSKCIPRMTTDAATALSTLQAENEKLRAGLEQVKRALAMMWFAYINSDKETPHSYETEALEEAESLLGPWTECMPKYLRRSHDRRGRGHDAGEVKDDE